MIDISYKMNKAEILEYINTNKCNWLDLNLLKDIPDNFDSKTNKVNLKQLKRLGLYIKYKRINIHNIFKNKIEVGCDTKTYHSTKYERCEFWNYNVYLCSSLNGNTGSSIIHDVIFNLKNVENVKILSYLINTSNFFKSENEDIQQHHKLNAYASLIEIDHLMGTDAYGEEKNWSSYPRNPYTIKYDSEDLKLNRIYDECYNHQFDYCSNYLNQAHLFGFDSKLNSIKFLISDISFIIFNTTGESNLFYFTDRKENNYSYPTNHHSHFKKRNYTYTILNKFKLNSGRIGDINENELKEIINSLNNQFDFSQFVNLNYLLTTVKPQNDEFNFILINSKYEFIINSILNNTNLDFNYNHFIFKDDFDEENITLIKFVCRFPACSFLLLKKYNNDYNINITKNKFFSDKYFYENASDLFQNINDKIDNLKWFTIGSALGKIYIEKGALVIEFEMGRKEPLYEGTRNKTNRASASEIFIKNEEYVNYISEYYSKFYDENGRPVLIEKIQIFYNSITSISILGKIFENIDKESIEYENIIREVTILKEFAMSFLRYEIKE
jgi:hypothetical protein